MIFMHNDNKLLKEHEAAEMLGLSVKTLQAWRFRGKGPRYIKLGHAVRYRPDLLNTWLNENLRDNTTQN